MGAFPDPVMNLVHRVESYLTLLRYEYHKLQTNLVHRVERDLRRTLGA